MAQLQTKTPIFPTIPEPVKGNEDSVYACIKAMKQTLEAMTGQRGDTPVARVFCQDTQPVAVKKGDLWMVQKSGSLYYWTGSLWLPET